MIRINDGDNFTKLNFMRIMLIMLRNIYRARCDGIDNRKRGRGTRKSSKTDRRGSGAGTVCLKAAVVDTARGISTQSKQRNRMRMRTSVVHSREVGGQTANLVPIVSVVVLRSFRPSRPPPLAHVRHRARSPRPLFRGFHAYESV